MNLHEEARKGLLPFVQQLQIETPSGRVRLGAVLADYQRQFFVNIEPALLRLIGRDVPCRWRRFFSEWARGHAKTFSLAVVILWLLVASKRPLRGIGAAGDKDQARLLRDAIEDIVRANSILEQLVTITAYKIENPRSHVVFEILSSDAATSYGQTPDIVVADELCHWTKPDLWHSLFSSAAKKSNSVLCVITNAGWKASDWWRVREGIRQDENWRFSSMESPQAPWITQADLAEQARHLPPQVFARLWLNQWCDTAGDALTLSDIDKSIVLSGAPIRAEQGQVYVGAFDIGLARNHSALVILSKNCGYSERISKPAPRYDSLSAAMIDTGLMDAPIEHPEYRHHSGDGRLRLVAVRVWKPEDGRVQLEDVEKEVISLHERFRLSAVGFDPWQATYLGQRLIRFGIPAAPTNFTPANLQAMATATLDAFRENQLDLFQHDQLLSDLRALRVQEKSYGYRLVSPEAEDGSHGDCATALALALLAARGVRSPYLTANRKLVLN